MPLCCTRPAGAAKRRSRAPATANRQKAALNHEERGGEGRNGSNASRSRIEDRLQFTLLFLFPFCCCSHSVPASRSIAFHDRHEVSLSLSFERKSCSGKTRQTALGSEGKGFSLLPFTVIRRAVCPAVGSLTHPGHRLSCESLSLRTE